MSNASDRHMPPPMAAPLIAPMTGWCMWRSVRTMSSSSSIARSAMVGAVRPAMFGSTPALVWSAPEQNPRPAPVTTRTRTSLSLLTASSVSRKGTITSNAIAFMRSGRFSVMSATCGRGWSSSTNDMSGRYPSHRPTALDARRNRVRELARTRLSSDAVPRGRRMRVSMAVNESTREDEVEPRLLLVQYLRDVCGLTGTKVGCDTSSCGTCTVLVDGESVKSCTMFAVQADGSSITTIEGLAVNHELHPMQQAFYEHHGLQCGFCTAGMVMAAVSLLDEVADPTERDVRLGLEGNLCRCTGYQNIVEAVMAAAGGDQR